MRQAQVTRSAAWYALAWTVATAVVAAVVGLGLSRWVLPAYAGYAGGWAMTVALRAAAPGIALVLVGVLAWKLVVAIALYRTLSAAFAAETADRLNTEAMKSDILSVMDERLAEINRDTGQTRRVVERMGSEDAADEFDFPDTR